MRRQTVNRNVPLRYVDTDELAVIFGYACAVGVVHSVGKGNFPVHTFKYLGKRVALRTDVQAYFKDQEQLARENAAEYQGKLDRKIIAREKALAVRESRRQAVEISAQRLALKEQKRKEAEHRRQLKAIEKAREIASRAVPGGIHKR